MENNIFELLDIDVKLLENTIEDAEKLDDNEAFFARLLEFSRAKKKLNDALEVIDAQEREMKGLINNKAKALYGGDWQTIAGQGYKINRSPTGVLYVMNEEVKPAKKFLIIKESLNTKAIVAEVEKTKKLPKGVEVNPSRGESISIKVTDNENA